MSEKEHFEWQRSYNLFNASVETQEFNLVALLKPRIFIDGDHWCVLWGENLQDGIAGFGKSPVHAVYDFNKAWHKALPDRKGTADE